MARMCSLLLAALVVVLLLLVSPIDCSRKHTAVPISQKQSAPASASKISQKRAAAPAPAKINPKPAAPAAKARSNYTNTPSPSTSIAKGSGGSWLSGAGATYYGFPNGDGSEGSCVAGSVSMGVSMHTNRCTY
jgi:hypothetical protein